MRREEFDNLTDGDIVRHAHGSTGYIVRGNYREGGVVIVDARIIHNPHEWDLIFKAHHERKDGA